MTEITYTVEDITPVRAAELLEGNTHNRNVRFRVVSKYARDMADGNWEGENGQSIVISADWRVIDGQHRLWAIIESNTTQRMLIVSGVSMAAQMNVDTQAKRSFGDVLKLNGESNANVLGSIARRVTMWQWGDRSGRGNWAPSHAQLLTTIDENPNLRRAASVAMSTHKHVGIHGSVIGLCYWLFDAIDHEDAEHFFALLRGDHDGLERGHPARTLTETMKSANNGRSRLNETTTAAYAIKAWNAYRDGRPVMQLKFRPGGANPEQFPEPK